MFTNKSISDFYKDVEKLSLKFPVAAIARETGFSKGQVSSYLSKKSDPSPNFLKIFYEKFEDSFKKVPHGNPNLTDKSKAYDALFSVLIADYAAWKGQQTGENPQVIVRKLYKAAEDVQQIG